MKRFYCTICKKTKRVRRIPLSVTTPYADSPLDRIGQCASHSPSVQSTKSIKSQSNKYAKVG